MANIVVPKPFEAMNFWERMGEFLTLTGKTVTDVFTHPNIREHLDPKNGARSHAIFKQFALDAGLIENGDEMPRPSEFGNYTLTAADRKLAGDLVKARRLHDDLEEMARHPVFQVYISDLGVAKLRTLSSHDRQLVLAHVKGMSGLQKFLFFCEMAFSGVVEIGTSLALGGVGREAEDPTLPVNRVSLGLETIIIGIAVIKTPGVSYASASKQFLPNRSRIGFLERIARIVASFKLAFIQDEGLYSGIAAGATGLSIAAVITLQAYDDKKGKWDDDKIEKHYKHMQAVQPSFAVQQHLAQSADDARKQVIAFKEYQDQAGLPPAALATFSQIVKGEGDIVATFDKLIDGVEPGSAPVPMPFLKALWAKMKKVPGGLLQALAKAPPAAFWLGVLGGSLTGPRRNVAQRILVGGTALFSLWQLAHALLPETTINEIYYQLSVYVGPLTNNLALLSAPLIDAATAFNAWLPKKTAYMAASHVAMLFLQNHWAKFFMLLISLPMMAFAYNPKKVFKPKSDTRSRLPNYLPREDAEAGLMIEGSFGPVKEEDREEDHSDIPDEEDVAANRDPSQELDALEIVKALYMAQLEELVELAEATVEEIEASGIKDAKETIVACRKAATEFRELLEELERKTEHARAVNDARSKVLPLSAKNLERIDVPADKIPSLMDAIARKSRREQIPGVKQHEETENLTPAMMAERKGGVVPADAVMEIFTSCFHMEGFMVHYFAVRDSTAAPEDREVAVVSISDQYENVFYGCLLVKGRERAAAKGRMPAFNWCFKDPSTEDLVTTELFHDALRPDGFWRASRNGMTLDSKTVHPIAAAEFLAMEEYKENPVMQRENFDCRVSSLPGYFARKICSKQLVSRPWCAKRQASHGVTIDEDNRLESVVSNTRVSDGRTAQNVPLVGTTALREREGMHVHIFGSANIPWLACQAMDYSMTNVAKVTISSTGASAYRLAAKVRRVIDPDFKVLGVSPQTAKTIKPNFLVPLAENRDFVPFITVDNIGPDTAICDLSISSCDDKVMASFLGKGRPVYCDKVHVISHRDAQIVSQFFTKSGLSLDDAHEKFGIKEFGELDEPISGRCFFSASGLSSSDVACTMELNRAIARKNGYEA